MKRILTLTLLLSALIATSVSAAPVTSNSAELKRIESKIALHEYARATYIKELARLTAPGTPQDEAEIDIFVNGLNESQAQLKFWKAEKTNIQ